MLIIFGLVSVEVLLRLLVLFLVILCKMWCMILFEWVFGRLGVYWIIFGFVIGLILVWIYVCSFLIRLFDGLMLFIKVI